MIVISICLSEIPAHARTTGKNGKIYANFVVDQRKEPDQYKNTHTVYVNQSKEEREAKKAKEYVGNGKEYTFGAQKPQESNSQQEDFASSDSDLPF